MWSKNTCKKSVVLIFLTGNTKRSDVLEDLKVDGRKI
jgi:hypothetical protein